MSACLQAIVRRDQLVTIIRDKFPKAKAHYLILPNARLPNLAALGREHLPLLAHMQTCAAALIAKSVWCGRVSIHIHG
jgi:aprataxin